MVKKIQARTVPGQLGREHGQGRRKQRLTLEAGPRRVQNRKVRLGGSQRVGTWIRVNDPSAGSPTETLLRLLLPLNDQV